MATYNNTLATLTCPRCNSTAECTVDLYFGDTSQMTAVALGSPYPFFAGRAPHNGGPFPVENPLGTAYTECSSCNRDFHCVAEIQDGLLVSVTPDMERPPYTPDREERNNFTCPECGTNNTATQYSNGFSVVRVICQSNACSFTGLFCQDPNGNIVQSPYNPALQPVSNK